MMADTTLSVAITEAQRFIEAAREAKRRLHNDKYVYITGSIETAACRRASMDLTRALARLRN